MNAEIDVRHILASVRVPTLVVYGRERAELARYVAERIPGATLVEDSPGDDSDVRALESFLARAREDHAQRVAQPTRVLATVLFTDLVGSTARALDLGPRWQELLREHNARIRQTLARYNGKEIDTAGDGFFASGFDGPARAIRCACAIRDAITSLGLEIRVGVHTGECDLVDEKLSGLAVAIGSRVAAHAASGEVLVSGTVRDLVAGSGIAFERAVRASSRASGRGSYTPSPTAEASASRRRTGRGYLPSCSSSAATPSCTAPSGSASASIRA
jgi:class 3 adenylate cyclase